MTGAGSEGVFWLPELEAKLEAEFEGSAVDTIDLSAPEFFKDRRGSRAYRENLVRVKARRAIAEIVATYAA